MKDLEFDVTNLGGWESALMVRVLAQSLARFLPADHVYLSAWPRERVSAEIHVSVDQFDVDHTGQGILVPRWRVLSRCGERVLKSGISRLSHQGPAATEGAPATIATLSERLADLSRQVVLALQNSTAPRRGSFPASPPGLHPELS